MADLIERLEQEIIDLERENKKLRKQDVDNFGLFQARCEELERATAQLEENTKLMDEAKTEIEFLRGELAHLEEQVARLKRERP